MGTKMKGLLKGLRYISQIFDEEKEPEMQIGFPTDVKHVAHIGWDGPSVDSPSWMKDFNAPQSFQSAPLSLNGEPKENPEIKWVSEDTKKANRTKPKEPKTSRRHSADGSLTSESPTHSSTKTRQSRRSKDSSDPTTKQCLGGESPSCAPPDIPKKSRRKKSKENVTGGGSTRPSRSKAPAPIAYTSPFSDPGPETGSLILSPNEFRQTSNLKPLAEEEENGHKQNAVP